MTNEEIYSVDDRGNEAIFYEKDENGEWKKVATLNREAGPCGNIDSVTTWDGGKGVTAWASDNGYSEEIPGAEKIVRLWMKEKKALRAKIFHYFAGEHSLTLLDSELEEVVGFFTEADNPQNVHDFKSKMPPGNKSIAFVCPIQKDRWEIGWMDCHKVRIEGGESYRVEELMHWFLLPEIPK